MKKKKTKTKAKKPKLHPLAGLFCALLVAAAVTVLFLLSVQLRAPRFGHCNANMAGAMTAGTVGVAKNWYREGIWKLRFAMYPEPASIEMPEPQDRTPYSSYPSGAAIPLYLLARLAGREPSVSMAMAYNLINQWLIALTLAGLAGWILRRMGFGLLAVGVFSLVPALLYFWLPLPYHEHLMGWFADQAILLPFMLFIALETLRPAHPTTAQRILFGTLQGMIAFWGVWTEYLFWLMLPCAFLIRLLRGGLGQGPGSKTTGVLGFWAIPASAAALFVAQLYSLGELSRIISRFAFRARFAAGPIPDVEAGVSEFSLRSLYTVSFDNRFWNVFIPAAYGPVVKLLIFAAVFLLIALLIWLLIRRLRKKDLPASATLPATLLFLLLAPCFLHEHLFEEHSSFLLHLFTALKFALPISLGVFVILPALALCPFVQEGKKPSQFNASAQLMLAVAMTAIALAYINSLATQRKAVFEPENLEPERIATFIGAHTGYTDVAFSTDYTVSRHFLSFSMKTVHRIQSLQEICALIEKTNGQGAVNLFQKTPEDFDAVPGLAELAAQSSEVFEDGELRLYRVPKEAISALCPIPEPGNEQ